MSESRGSSNPYQYNQNTPGIRYNRVNSEENRQSTGTRALSPYPHRLATLSSTDTSRMWPPFREQTRLASRAPATTLLGQLLEPRAPDTMQLGVATSLIIG